MNNNFLEDDVNLKRELGLQTATVIVVGNIIGLAMLLPAFLDDTWLGTFIVMAIS